MQNYCINCGKVLLRIKDEVVDKRHWEDYKYQMSEIERHLKKEGVPNPRAVYERSVILTRELLMLFCYPDDHTDACIIFHRGTDPTAIDDLRLRTVSVDFVFDNGLDDVSRLEGKVLKVSIEDAPSSPTSEETSVEPEPGS